MNPYRPIYLFKHLLNLTVIQEVIFKILEWKIQVFNFNDEYAYKFPKRSLINVKKKTKQLTA